MQADAQAFVTVIDHLLDNAIKYSPGGEPVEVDVQVTGDEVRVRVTDAGIGMDAEQAARCFEKFWQAESTDVRRFGGTGIGLYIVHSLVEAMKGDIEVSSVPGAGTAFTVTLRRAGVRVPRRRAGAGQGAVGHPRVHAPDRSSHEDRRMRSPHEAAVAGLNLLLGVVYLSYGAMTIIDLRRGWDERGFSHFGLAWIAMAFTCGPHHFEHGLHIALAGRNGGALDLIAVVVGLPAGVTWFLLRVEALAGGRGDRFISGTPRWVAALPALSVVYLVVLVAAAGAMLSRRRRLQPEDDPQRPPARRVLPDRLLPGPHPAPEP